MRVAHWGILALVVVNLGCGMFGSKHGRSIDRDALADIIKGKTTMAEVERSMGEPQSKETSSDGTTWTYTFLKVTAGSSKQESVAIVFDEKSVVSDVKESSWSY
jgi:hypothetical protein